jgi:hypothetical protein
VQRGGLKNLGRSWGFRNLGEPFVTGMRRACNLKMFCSCHQAFRLVVPPHMCKKNMWRAKAR